MSTDYTNIALKYAEAGIKVFPCDPTVRRPLCRNGFKAATTDKKAIKRWWKQHPEALIGGVCDDQFLVVDVDLKNGGPAFESLGKIHRYVTKAGASVTTMSNGCHYYFKYDESIRRKIKVLDSVDILGKGGYVVLPDGKRYTQTGDIDTFIGQLSSNLPDIDHDFADHIRGDVEIPALAQVREHKAPTKRKSEPTAKQKDEEEFRDEVADAIEAATIASHNKMYDRVGKNAGYMKVNFNGEPLQLKHGSMTTELFKGIFHNKEVQKRLATHMGIPVPDESTGRGVTFRSLLPTHHDGNPSMAARWVEREDGGSTLIVRDFSDHYKNQKEDYNLTRLMMVQRYGKNYRRPSPTEFYVWSLRLMEEAGVVSFLSPKFNGITKHLTEGQKKAAEGFLKLVGIKSLWKGGTKETCYSQKFAAAWTGVSTETVNKMKAKAIKFGIIEKSGQYHGEGAMRTPIFNLGEGAISVEEINTIPELVLAVNQQLRRKKAKTGVGSKIMAGRASKTSSQPDTGVTDTNAHTQEKKPPERGEKGWLAYRLKENARKRREELNKQHTNRRDLKYATE